MFFNSISAGFDVAPYVVMELVCLYILYYITHTTFSFCQEKSFVFPMAQKPQYCLQGSDAKDTSALDLQLAEGRSAE